MEGIEPVTSKKRTRSKGKGKKVKAGDPDAEPVVASSSRATTIAINVAVETTRAGRVRRRSRPTRKVATPRNIPTSWDDADPADKLLVTMKENGDDWKTIREAWKAETGQEPAESSLPNRYNRIKVRLMHLKEGDVCTYLLFSCSADFGSANIGHL